MRQVMREKSHDIERKQRSLSKKGHQSFLGNTKFCAPAGMRTKSPIPEKLNAGICL